MMSKLIMLTGVSMIQIKKKESKHNQIQE